MRREDGATLDVRGLAFVYGARPALHEIDFEARPGRILGILGPNGAGKTTTLSCLAGLATPSAGSVRWTAAERIVPPHVAAALIPEQPAVLPWLTVDEHLRFVALSRSLARGWERTAESLLERLALSAERAKTGRTLSKGTRQRVLIAAALLSGCGALLLDEPFAGLDPRGQHVLMQILRELRARGKTIVVSTHSLALVADACDDVLILREGSVAEYGPAADVRARSGMPLDELFFKVTA